MKKESIPTPNRLTRWISSTLRLAAVIALTVPTLASASIIASDNFEPYITGASLDGQGTSADGWAGAWTLNPAATDVTLLVDKINQMNYTPPGGTLIPGGTNSLQLDTGGDGFPVIARQLFTPQAGTFYAAFAMKFGGNTVNGNDRFGVYLGQDSLSMTNGGLNLAYVGAGGRAYFQILQGTGPFVEAEGYPTGGGGNPGRSSLWYIVLKFEKTDAGNFNKITAWVNPGATSETDLPNGDLQLLEDLDVNSISVVSAWAQGLDPGDIPAIDNVALATTFADLMAPAGPGPANPIPPNTVQVETLADGSGTVVPPQNITSGNSITVYAVGRTSGGAFEENVAATSWSLANVNGAVVDGDLQPAPDSKSATFTGAGVGSANIVATVAGAANIVSSGTITVLASPAAQVRVETAADGTGTVLPAQTVNEFAFVTGYAISRDAAGNFLANVAATWSLTNITGNIVNSDVVSYDGGFSANFIARDLPGTCNMHASVSGLTSVDSGTITVLRPMTWAGVGANWDYTSLNFYNYSFILSNFVTSDDVIFDGTGVAAPEVNLVGDLTPRSVTVSGSTAYTLQGAGKVTGDATFTQSGGEPLTILTDNDYTGQTTLSGPVVLGNGGSTGSLGAGGDIRFNSPTTITYNRTNSLVMNNRIYNSSGQLIVNSGTLTLAGTVGNAVSPTVMSGATLVLAKSEPLQFSATGNWGIEPGGTVLLGGYPGSQIASVGGAAFTTNNGTLDLRGQSEAIIPWGSGVFESSVFPYGNCTLTLGNSAVDSEFTGLIKDSGWDGTNALSVTKDGSRTMLLGGTSPNTYHGTTTVNGGVLQLANANAIPHGAGFGNVQINPVSTLDLNGNNVTINGLNGTTGVGGPGNVVDNLATTTSFTVGDGDGDGSYVGGITGTFGVTKIGGGTQTFSGTTDYTGATTVSGGTLLINGSLPSSAVTVSAAGTLGGTGTIGQPVTVNGTLKPGNSIGTLTVTNTVTLAGMTVMEVANGTSSDRLVGNTINLGGTLTVMVLGGPPQAGDTFTLFSASNPFSGTFGANVNLPTLGGGLTWDASQLEVNGTLTVVGGVVGPDLVYTYNGGAGTLSFSWTGDYKLQSQTNSLASGLSGAWVDYPNGTNGVVVPVNPLDPTVFFRLAPTAP